MSDSPHGILRKAQESAEKFQAHDAAHRTYTYANPACLSTMPKDTLPNSGLGQGSLIKQLIMDELLLDGNPRQNLASFVTT